MRSDPRVGWGEIRLLIHQPSPIQWFSSLIAIKQAGGCVRDGKEGATPGLEPGQRQPDGARKQDNP